QGVFDAVARITPTTRPTLALQIADADFATSDLSADGVNGAIHLLDLSPPVTAPNQTLVASKLRIGGAEFTDGKLAFDANARDGITIQNTQWQWLGGQVSTADVHVPADVRHQPVKLTLHAQSVDLKQLLDLLAKDKASGEGKL